jgi:ABC-type transport system involved in multi-copper enzyme maturation permease subunit
MRAPRALAGGRLDTHNVHPIVFQALVTARRIGLVAWHVFKENVRDRVLYGLAGFAVLLFGVAILIGQITAGQDIKIVKDLGLAAIELSGVLMAVLIGVGLVAREIDRRTIYSVLSKPLARWEFIVGKFAGLVLTLSVNVLAMAAVLFVILAILGATGWAAPGGVPRAGDVPIVDPALLVAVVLILGELALLTAIALFFSTFSSGAWLSVVFTLGLFVAGQFSADLRAFADIVPSPLVAGVTRAIALVLPAFSAFDIKAQVVHGVHVPAGFVMMTLLYGALYASAAIGAAIAVFARREFK